VATLQEIRKRIVGVEKTQKITKAMKTVSAAKLGRATRAIHAARPYAEKIREVMAAISAGVDPDAHPLLVPRESPRRLDVVVFTSDRGLCGAFNHNIIKRAEELIVARQPRLDAVSVIPVGRKGAEYFRRHSYGELPREWIGLGQASQDNAREIAELLMERYESGETDEVVLVFAEFQSALTQHPREQRLLPMVPEPRDAPVESVVYATEPDPESLLLESQAGEHGARMTAMDNATSNTAELIETLTLTFNKARQAEITAELVEIVGGAEAL
jgi:F-type H+-transporting ATPase subunit gamma